MNVVIVAIIYFVISCCMWTAAYSLKNDITDYLVRLFVSLFWPITVITRLFTLLVN
jgi:hypothetical protein